MDVETALSIPPLAIGRGSINHLSELSSPFGGNKDASHANSRFAFS